MGDMRLIGLAAVLSTTLAVAEPAKPTAATQGLMLELASGKRDLMSLVDPAAGVALVDHFVGAGADKPVPPIEKLMCGKALDKLIADYKKQMSTAVPEARGENRLECSNKPGPPTCTYGRSMEWDPAVHFIFRPDPARGLALTAITVDDEVMVDEKFVAKRHALQAKRIAELTAKSCP
jgi:hypothetical protein